MAVCCKSHTDQTIKQRELLLLNLAVTAITIRLYRLNDVIVLYGPLRLYKAPYYDKKIMISD